jgi:outer membrane protein
MKNLFKFVFVVVVLAVFGDCAYAQKVVKLAHIDSQALIQTMPEYDSAVVKIQKIGKELEAEMESQQVELNRKYEEFQKNQAGWTELVRNSRQQELVTMQQKLEEFRQSAGESFQQEQAKVFQPVREKAIKAIEEVAKEQGITYVLEAQGVVLFKSIDSQDLLPAVKQHLGIKK